MLSRVEFGLRSRIQKSGTILRVYEKLVIEMSSKTVLELFPPGVKLEVAQYKSVWQSRSTKLVLEGMALVGFARGKTARDYE